MTEFATSSDGTRIAYDREGEGPAVIFVGGAFQHRAVDPETRDLASRLAARGLTVLNYDRRGRGESGGDPPLTLEAELRAIRALIDAAGGRAALFGMSSGGAISLAAAAAELPVTAAERRVTALALWEVPLDPAGDPRPRIFLKGLRQKIRAGDRGPTVEYFLQDFPPEWIAAAKKSPVWADMTEVSASLEVDAESLAVASSAPRVELWGGIAAPVLVLVGTDTLPAFPPAADEIVAAIPTARRVDVPGRDHRWDPDEMPRVLGEFLLDSAR
jgi:pimeloyl-ACP methyl ester carboxylesterase